MAEVLECKHGDDSPFSCPPCMTEMRGSDFGRTSELSNGFVIKAEFGGTCPECMDDIRPGQRIKREDDAWVHERHE